MILEAPMINLDRLQFDKSQHQERPILCLILEVGQQIQLSVASGRYRSRFCNLLTRIDAH